MDFIKIYWKEIGIIIVLLIWLVGQFIWLIKKNGLRGAIVKLIVSAEERFQHGENEAKLNYVIDKFILLIPVPFSFFITRDTVKKFIQRVFDETKEALDYNSNIKGA